MYLCIKQSSMQNYILSLVFLFSVLIAQAQIPIADAKTMAVGSTVTVRGVVTCFDEFNTSLRYIQDESAGIAVYDPDFIDDTITPGTLIEVTGSYEPFNNLSEIVSLTDLQVLTQEDIPQAETLGSLAAGFQETWEGSLVRFEGVTFVDSGNFNSGSDNYTITDGVTEQTVRVWGSTDIAGTPIPSEVINIVGIMGQYQDTYQLQPLALTDFDFGDGAPVFLTSLNQENITSSSFDITFETLMPGSTVINYSTNPANLSAEASDAALVTDHSITLTGLSPATIYYVQGTSIGSNGASSVSGVQVMMTASNSSGRMDVYFNRPVDNGAATIENAVYLNQTFADTVIHYIQSAEETLDIAIYNVDNNNGIIDAINAAYDNGVAVRFITDFETSDNNYNQVAIGASNKKKGPEPGFQNSPSGGSYRLMHNKFLIADANHSDPNKPIIMTGSTNWTDAQINTDANNLVIIQDQSLAKAFEVEFNEMFVDNVFGPEKTDNTPKKFNINGKEVELYFSPSDDTENKIKQTVNSANHDLYAAVFSYTRFGISFEIDQLIPEGVFVAGIVEDTIGSDAQFAFDVIAEDVPGQWILDENSYILHHKYLIVDAHAPNSDPQVLTGSHNWSNSAQFSNDENTIIIHDASIANQFYQEWKRRFTDSGGNIFAGINDLQTPYAERFTGLFPNPVKQKLRIRYEADKPENAVLSIFNTNGLLMETIEFNAASGLNEWFLDVNDFAAGIYHLQMQTDSKFVTGKVSVVK